MNQNKNNKIHSQSKSRITLDTNAAVPVKDQRPIARLYKLFSCFNKQYGKGVTKQ